MVFKAYYPEWLMEMMKGTLMLDDPDTMSTLFRQRGKTDDHTLISITKRYPNDNGGDAFVRICMCDVVPEQPEQKLEFEINRDEAQWLWEKLGSRLNGK